MEPNACPRQEAAHILPAGVGPVSGPSQLLDLAGADREVAAPGPCGCVGENYR